MKKKSLLLKIIVSTPNFLLTIPPLPMMFKIVRAPKLRSRQQFFLQRDPANRLGYGPNGFENIKRHPFFKPIRWKKLEQLDIPSPFLPAVEGAECINNFDKEYTDQPALDTPCGTPDYKSSLDPFKNFTYTEPSLLATYKPKS